MSNQPVDARVTHSADFVDRVADATTGCCQCIGYSFVRSWLCVKAGTFYVWTCVSRSLGVCCVKEDESRKSRKSVKKITRNPVDRLSQPSEVQALSRKTTDSAQQKRQKSKSSRQLNLALNKSPVEQPSTTNIEQPLITTSQVGSIQQNEILTTKNKERRYVTSEISQKPMSEPQPSPPKIDFVETGSIFGHRKRQSSANLLMLDNGRFRSPGQPNITTGPNGRTIRISFQTGFPSLKSVESRASLTAVKTVNSKQSLEPDLSSNPSQSNPATEEG